MPEIKNYTEVCVKDMIESMLPRLDCCKCDNCKYDIMAIALNSLPPKYVVTHTGQIYTKLNALQNQFEADIIAAITRAVKMVTAKPRHGDAK